MEKSLVMARMSLASVVDDCDTSSETEIFSFFKGIDKGYIIFRVVMCNRLVGEEFSFVSCNVLPAMKQCVPFKTKVCLL